MKICTSLLAISLVTAAFGAGLSPNAARIDEVLRQLNVKAAAGDLAPAPIPGFLEIVRGTQVLYVAEDGGMLIDGDILSIDTRTNLTETSRARARRDLVAAIPADQRLVVPASGRVRARITVFVDTDCPYCLRLHQDAANFANRGIEIQYLFFPRSGREGDSWSQAEAVWCAADRIAALEAALENGSLPEAHCDNPVATHYELAMAMGLKGTPAILTESGRLHYGMLTADEILLEQARWASSRDVPVAARNGSGTAASP